MDLYVNRTKEKRLIDLSFVGKRKTSRNENTKNIFFSEKILTQFKKWEEVKKVTNGFWYWKSC